MFEVEHVVVIEADDAAIAAALQDAHIPSLVLALVHLTGDMSLVRGDIRPVWPFTLLALSQQTRTPEADVI